MSKENFQTAEKLTRQFTSQESISDPENPQARANEVAMARKIKKELEARGIPSMLQKLPDGRENVFAFIKGKTTDTLVLAGHFDTVGVLDYYQISGVTGKDPFNPDKISRLTGIDSSKYIAGRGSFDMKSGIAVAITLLDQWNQAKNLNGSILFVATCDEENNSEGILNAVDVLLATKGEKTGDALLDSKVKALISGNTLNLMGAINMDYTTQRYPEDPEYHVWSGTIGKMLPSLLVKGVETHAGEHFGGFHATSLISRIVTEIEGNISLSGNSLPPSTLKLTDSRTSYSVMTPSTARAFFNVFSVGQTPTEILTNFKEVVTRSLHTYCQYIQTNYAEYCRRMRIPHSNAANWVANSRVLTFSEISSLAVNKPGTNAYTKIINQTIAQSQEDGRDKSFAIVESLLKHTGLEGPLVAIFFGPPFYPYVKPDTGKLAQATHNAINQTGKEFGIQITMHDFYPYISDMSYLKLEPEIHSSLKNITEQIPVWDIQDPLNPNRKVYSLSLEKIARLNLPLVNIGPYGFDAHKRRERVEKFYTFQVLPKIIDRAVRRFFKQ